jgi:hypothetical protein
MSKWQATVSFRTSGVLTDDAAFDLIDSLADHGAVVSVDVDRMGAEVILSLDDGNTLDAASIASDLVTRAADSIVGVIEVVGLEVLSEDAVDANLTEPLYPPVVGYAEIAEMAGVTRQRARQFAQIDGFPEPVIETAQGPLMSKNAVARWLERRNTKTGRPRSRAAFA